MTTKHLRRAGARTGALRLVLPVGLALAPGAVAHASEAATASGDDHLPRIHFTGKFLCNSGTGNNNDVHDQFIDVDNVVIAEEFRHLSLDALRQKQFETFGRTKEMNGGWNLFGDQSTYFTDAAITAVRGKDGMTTTDDPLVGQFVNIVGEDGNFPIIVMPNPQGGIESQLFVGGITIGNSPVPGIPSRVPGPTTFALRASHNARAYSRWIGRRNAAPYHGQHNGYLGCVWQFEIPADQVDIMDAPPGSLLADLLDAVRENDGLLVQWASYLLEPQISNEDHLEMFERGEFTQNPAVGLVTGSILVKRTDDFATVINGRRLQPLEPQPPNMPFPMATVTVDTAKEIVTLNLISGVPENGYDPNAQVKKNIGDLFLGVYLPGQERREDAKVIGMMIHGPSPGEDPPSYGYARYVQTGGLVDFSYGDNPDIDDMRLEEGRLILFSRGVFGEFATWIEETSDPTILSDDHVTYLDIGDEVFIELHLDVPGPHTLYFWEYQFTITERQPELNITRQRVGNYGELRHKLDYPRVIDVPAGARSVPVFVKGLEAGPATLAYELDLDPPPPGGDFPVVTGFYARFRVMPDDDFSQYTHEERVEPDFMYDHVFRYYEWIFPAMGEHIMHFAGPRIMDNGAQGLLYRVEETLWPSSLYMPRTRALSDGKRDLIREWAEAVQPPKP